MNLITEQNATVLIVDDNPANLSVLSDALDQAGLEVWVAKSGRVALERVKYALPNLILLDIMMPEMDGLETCRQLKASPETKNIPIIFMTALSDTANKVEGFQVGAVDYITKPFQQEEVLSRVQLHLKLYDLSKKLEQKNLLLEQKVAEVTQAYDDLEQMQIQLIQNEKISSLGQVVTGIAREIDNPVNFICGNLLYANKYIEDILTLLNLYQEDYPNPTPRIQKEIEKLDIDFVRSDLVKLFNSMRLGTERIQEIVKTIRTFSRIDEANLKAVNIHEGIDSAIAILNHRFKATPKRPSIEVIKEYSELPLVECWAKQLNQVFLNLLTNAIDALEDYEQQRSFEEIQQQPNQIKISTNTSKSDKVTICISDNGLGIDEKNQEKLFTPFFATQPIDKNQLGLSISHEIIVKKHNGNLYCQSNLGKGAEFIIEIPIKQQVIE